MRLIYISLYKIVKCSTTSSLHGLLIPRKKHIHKLVTDKCQTVLQLVVVPTKKTTTWFSDCVLQSDILHRDLLIKTVTMKPTYLSKERVSLWWIPPPREPPFGHFCCSLRQKQTELQQCLNPLKTWCLTVLRHICGIGLTAWQSGAGTDSGGKRHMVPLSRGRAASSAVGLEPPRHLAERWECFTVGDTKGVPSALSKDLQADFEKRECIVVTLVTVQQSYLKQQFDSRQSAEVKEQGFSLIYFISNIYFK